MGKLQLLREYQIDDNQKITFAPTIERLRESFTFYNVSIVLVGAQENFRCAL